MQNKITRQLPFVSLTKSLVLLTMLFSLSACGSSDSSTAETENGTTSENGSTTTQKTLPEALESFKAVATDAGLTAE